jgi:hypothetical protein
MGVATTTTYFVGGHYEVTNGVVTKYYYAEAQRIAMRTNGSLFYLLGDHPSPSLRTGLGSTSLTTDAPGSIVSELRYRGASLWDKACPTGALREGETLESYGK